MINPYENMLLLRVFPCRPGYCLENNTCLNGSTGVLCSLCQPNHAMSGGTCESCESDVNLDHVRKVLVVCVSIGSFAAWILLCCIALLPSLQASIIRLINMFQSLRADVGLNKHAESASCLSDALETTTDCAATIKETVEECLPSELFEGDAATAMFKIVISFYQVVSSFLNFNVSRCIWLYPYTFIQ